MERDIAIKVENVSKIYKLYDKPVDRLKEAINPFRKNYHQEFHAISDVSFIVKKGETVGVIGKNGSGKSTLLKIITGVLSHTSGNVSTNGKVSSLLELGAGFNPEYTGIENIHLNGTILGYTKEQVDERIEDILSFADIGDFIYQPVKLYSSGMFVRLAFAVAINVDPDILLVDEALSVGDIRFQQKCYRKIEEFRERKTVLFVTHDLSIVNKFCNRAIWMNEGKVTGDGSVDEITKRYQAYMIGSNLSKYELDIYETGRENKLDSIDLIDDQLDVLGDNKAKILGIAFLDGDTNKKISVIMPGHIVKLAIRVQFNEIINQPIVGFTLKDRLGNIVTQTNSFVLGEKIKGCQGQTIDYYFEFVFPNLSDGHYSVSPAIASGTLAEHTQHSWVHDALVFQVLGNQSYHLQGLMFLGDIKFYMNAGEGV